MSTAEPIPGPCAFLGTSEFAVPGLRALVSSGEVVSLVVTQPDRPAGRGRHPEPSPVKAAAQHLRLPVYQPENINSPEAIEKVGAASPELLVVIAYGQILKKPLLELPGRAAVNLHASLLPLHRGPSPVAWTILEGDPQAGNTTMIMDEGLDSGPILLQDSFALSPRFTRGDLEFELSRRGAVLLVETLRRLRREELAPMPQDHARATWSRLLTRSMRAVDWNQSAARIMRQIHALSPTPAVLATVRGRLVKLLRADVVESSSFGDPGRVTELRKDGPVVGCGEGGALLLTEVQPSGKRPMSGGDFSRGGGVVVGDVLEGPDDA